MHVGEIYNVFLGVEVEMGRQGNLSVIFPAS